MTADHWLCTVRITNGDRFQLAGRVVAFSCKKRGFCPSCGARRMAESTALLVDEVFPEQPVRQWVLSVPFPLRLVFASRPEVMGRVLCVVYRCIATHLIKKAGLSRKTAQTGAVTLIQRLGSALLCPTDAVNDFVGTIRNLCDEKAQLHALGANARQRAVEFFAIERMADR